jgi:hypothetical protein
MKHKGSNLKSPNHCHGDSEFAEKKKSLSPRVPKRKIHLDSDYLINNGAANAAPLLIK